MFILWNQWYVKAQGTAGDLLNGQLLFIVGILFVLYVVWKILKQLDGL